MARRSWPDRRVTAQHIHQHLDGVKLLFCSTPSDHMCSSLIEFKLNMSQQSVQLKKDWTGRPQATQVSQTFVPTQTPNTCTALVVHQATVTTLLMYMMHTGHWIPVGGEKENLNDVAGWYPEVRCQRTFGTEVRGLQMSTYWSKVEGHWEFRQAKCLLTTSKKLICHVFVKTTFHVLC